MSAPALVAPPPAEWDLLLSFAQKNLPDKIRELVDLGVSPNHANAVGQSALHIAALWGHVDSVRVLLEAGANPNAKNRLMGSTPLHMVAQSHKASLDDALRVVDLLRAHGADVSVPDDQGSVPVSAVVDPSKEALRDRLLPRRPPVFEAIASTNPDDAQAAVAGDPGCVNITFMGLTPVGGAIERLLAAAEAKDDARLPGALAVLQLLVEGGGRLVADTGTPSIATDWTDVPPLSQTLEALRLSPKAHPPSTPVLREAVLLLVKAGAPVTADDRECLHRAARRNDLEMARFMVERMNVDPNTRGPGGMTPLHFAARSGHLEALQYLLSLPGLDSAATDDRGHTALEAARTNGKPDIVAALEPTLGREGSAVSSASIG